MSNWAVHGSLHAHHAERDKLPYVMCSSTLKTVIKPYEACSLEDVVQYGHSQRREMSEFAYSCFTAGYYDANQTF